MKIYENVLKPASPEEVITRKKLGSLLYFKEWCDKNKIKYEENNKGDIISFDENTVNKQDEFGYTALMIACINNLINIVELLLDNGADVNIKNNYDGREALVIAKEYNYDTIVKLLLNYK